MKKVLIGILLLANLNIFGVEEAENSGNEQNYSTSIDGNYYAIDGSLMGMNLKEKDYFRKKFNELSEKSQETGKLDRKKYIEVLKEYIDDIKINDRICNDQFYIDDFSSGNGFQLALAIQKSFEWGNEIPRKFLQNIVASPIFENDLSFLLDGNGHIRDIYDIMTELNKDILNYPFDFHDAALKFYMSETDDREYEAEMGRYEEFDDIFMNTSRVDFSTI